MKIIGWGHFDYDNLQKDKDGNIINVGEQKEYREIDDPNPQETYMNLCEEIRKHGYKFDGPYHQNGKMGCPIAEDGSYITHSYRSWGGVMADAWSCVDKIGYNYMDFYMMDNYSDDFKTPEYDLPGFVKPERPIERKPQTHLVALAMSSDISLIKKASAEFLEKFKNLKFREIERNELGELLEAMTKIKTAINGFESHFKEHDKIVAEFYVANPQFDPKGIATLKSKDGLKSVRVYKDYASETYESVMEKYPIETCTDNQLETVFPDWNRVERTFSGSED